MNIEFILVFILFLFCGKSKIYFLPFVATVKVCFMIDYNNKKLLLPLISGSQVITK